MLVPWRLAARAKAEPLNRVCCHFEPDEAYWRHNHLWSPPTRRFAWFGRDLEPGVLYLFGYNTPNKIEGFLRLQTPDYSANTWKSRDEAG